MTDKTKKRIKKTGAIIGAGGLLVSSFVSGRFFEAYRILDKLPETVKISQKTGKLVLDKVAIFEFIAMVKKK